MFKLIDDTNTNNLKLIPRSGARRFHPSVIEITTSRLRILRSGLQKSVEVFSATLSDPSIKAMVELTAQVAIDENLKADESIQAEHQRIVHHFAALEENTSP